MREYWAFNLTPRGTIIVYDHTGTEKYRIVDPLPNVQVGLDVASLQGDLEGDGCDDFVSTGLDTQNRGVVVCFSGRTGAVLRVSYGEQPGDKLVNAGACGDIDGDGVPDLITGQTSSSPPPNGQIVSAWSGRDGTFLARWYRSTNGFSCMAESVAMLGPAPGERYGSAVYAERCWSSFSNNCTVNALCPGLVWARRGAPPGVREYGSPRASSGQPLAHAGIRMGRVLATQGTRLFAQWLRFAPGNLQAHGSTAGQRFLLR